MAKKPIAKTPVKKITRKAPAKPAPKPRPATKSASKVVSKAVVKKAAKSAATPRPKPAKKSVAEPVVPLTAEAELLQVDEQLVKLLNARASLYLQKMKGVQTPSKIIFSDFDQQQVWEMIEGRNLGPLTSAEIKTIFRPLLSAGRQRFESRMGGVQSVSVSGRDVVLSRHALRR